MDPDRNPGCAMLLAFGLAACAGGGDNGVDEDEQGGPCSIRVEISGAQDCGNVSHDLDDTVLWRGTDTWPFTCGLEPTLTAGGWCTFVGWGGDCEFAGSSNTCKLTVDRQLHVIATFSNP